MLADVSFPDIDSGPITFNLTDRGRFTSQLVKFSHHPQGLSLFSQTGLVRSDVRRQSFPLTGPIGRLFHATLVDPEQFKPLKRLKPRRLYLVFSEGREDVPAYQLDGLWHRKADVVRNATGAGPVGPVTEFLDRHTGDGGPTIFYGAPVGSRVEPHVLVLKGRPCLPPTGATQPSVIFLGGYDMHEVGAGQLRSAAKSRGALAAVYPVFGSLELRARLGSVDFQAGAGTGPARHNKRLLRAGLTAPAHRR